MKSAQVGGSEAGINWISLSLGDLYKPESFAKSVEDVEISVVDRPEEKILMVYVYEKGFFGLCLHVGNLHHGNSYLLKMHKDKLPVQVNAEVVAVWEQNLTEHICVVPS